ncbi:MAG: sugar nucleotide-binding protein [Candidatus Omnitrophica bacterium]|nr:sugar nucleotide-binding protein [Candidatus Omnitrophota bacterium]
MKNDRILVLGAGFIGKRLREEFDCAICDKEISSHSQAEKEILKHHPRIIINCIGNTGINVDDCERDKDRSLLSNAFVPLILAEAALRQNIRLVHVSSGCIFNFNYAADKPLNEEKTPDFLGLFYSRTKIYAELPLRILASKYRILIPRIRIPLDNRPHPRNILTKLLASGKVIDLPNSITYLPDFALALKHLLRIQATGIYNIVNKGVLKYPELMETYKKYVPDFKYKRVGFKRLGLTRTNLLLSTKKLEKTGFKMRDIHAVLDECVRQYLDEKR